MKKEDGDKILKALEEFVNVELIAGNRITKYNGNALLGIMMQALNQSIIGDKEKEELWNAHGKEWLDEKRKAEEEEKNKKEKQVTNKVNKEMKKESIDIDEIIDISEPIRTNLLNEKLKNKDKM